MSRPDDYKEELSMKSLRKIVPKLSLIMFSNNSSAVSIVRSDHGEKYADRFHTLARLALVLSFLDCKKSRFYIVHGSQRKAPQKKNKGHVGIWTASKEN